MLVQVAQGGGDVWHNLHATNQHKQSVPLSCATAHGLCTQIGYLIGIVHQPR